MTPSKRKKVNVQEILNNPVQSNQPSLRFKREGIWGWLSYLGFSLSVVTLLAMTFAQTIEYVYRDVFWIEFPFYRAITAVFIIMLIGLVPTLLTMWKSPYRIPKIIKWCYIGILGTAVIMGGLAGYFYYYSGMTWFLVTGPFTVWLYIFGWYTCYFYRKSRDGYRRVWLKVLIFSLVPFLPLLYCHIRESSNAQIPQYMGDYLEDPGTYGYQ